VEAALGEFGERENQEEGGVASMCPRSRRATRGGDRDGGGARVVLRKKATVCLVQEDVPKSAQRKKGGPRSRRTGEADHSFLGRKAFW